jgi:hypothetical protein
MQGQNTPAGLRGGIAAVAGIRVFLHFPRGWDKSAVIENKCVQNPRSPALGLHLNLYSHKRCRKEEPSS